VCMGSVTKTNIFKEQLLEFSLFSRGVHVPEDDNLGSMVEIKKRGISRGSRAT
jgi:hypothetical protein